MWTNILAVVVGFILWSVLWLGGNPVLARFFPGAVGADGAVRHSGFLLTLLVLSVVASLAAGYLAAAIAPASGNTPVWILGGLLLAVGIFFQSQSWALMPLWFHLPFLLLLVPMVIVGASLRG
jgi:hypothetical protein